MNNVPPNPGMTPVMVSLMTQHPEMVQMLAAMPPAQLATTVQGLQGMPLQQQEQMAQMVGITPAMLTLVRGKSAEELGEMLQAMLKMGGEAAPSPSAPRAAAASPDQAEATAASSLPPGLPEGKKRELKRDTAILRELDDSDSPDLLVLYHHIRDQSFDCFNAGEYNEQMLQYYAGGISVVMVVPRRIRENEYFLVCLQHKQPERNILCELSFLCYRQFCGVSMLVKKKCFVCNNPTKLKCTSCKCACFCSKECQAAGWKKHKKLCKLIKASSVAVETECVQVEL
jgi:hypothetical protein